MGSGGYLVPSGRRSEALRKRWMLVIFVVSLVGFFGLFFGSFVLFCFCFF